jgi:predicted secreted protein
VRNNSVPDLPDRVDLRVGESRSFEFRGVPSTGYSWQHEIVGDEDVVQVEWSRAARGAPTTVPQGGAGTVETMTVTGVQPGAARLRVRWRRRWDPPDVAKEEHLVMMTVSAT